MRKHYYVITFDTKKGGDKSWIINIEADNRNEAVNLVKAAWPNKAHMFHINARRLKPNEEFLYHWFTITN